MPTIKGCIWLRCQSTVGKNSGACSAQVCLELDCPNCTGEGILGGESCSPRVTLEAAFQRAGRDGEDEEAAWAISRAACGLTLMVWLLDCSRGGGEEGGRVSEHVRGNVWANLSESWLPRRAGQRKVGFEPLGGRAGRRHSEPA